MSRHEKLVHRKLLAGNSILNLGTGTLISVLNLIFVPPMLHTFGTELYGVLSVTWVVLANLSWLDFGFSRASAKYVAHELGLGRPREASMWTWTAVITQTVMGALGAVILWTAAPVIVKYIHVTPNQRDLVILTLRVFAFSIPIDFATRSMSGVIQAGQRFDWMNGLGLFSNLFTFGVYTLGIIYGANFLIIIYGLFALRIVNLIGAYWGACKILPELKSLPNLETLPQSYRSHVYTMIKYGSWVALASVIGPLILYFDQSIVSVIIGVAFLPFYTIPFNLLSRLGLFPSSLTSTLFPAFSALQARVDWHRIEVYFVRAHRYLLTALIPMLFVVYVWAPEILRLWISADFSAQATPAFRVLAFGYGIALLAPLSGALIEAVGRPDLLAKLYLVELPLNVLIVWELTKHFGIVGAALSYTIRCTIETVIVWWIVFRAVKFSYKKFLKEGLLIPSSTLILTGLATLVIRSGSIKSAMDIGMTLVTLALYCFCVWYLILDIKDKQFIYEMASSYRIGASQKEKDVLAVRPE
jgi:O-antigen/teichoic acid export membrane protein